MPAFPEITTDLADVPAGRNEARPPAASALLRYGSVAFSTGTAAHSELRRRVAWRWEEVDVVHGKPNLQWIGLGADVITLTGAIVPGLGRIATLDALRGLASEGRPHSLVGGDGTDFGQWVLTEMEEGQSALLRDGTPRKAEFTVTFAHYGEDVLAELIEAGQRAGSMSEVVMAAQRAVDAGADADGVLAAVNAATPAQAAPDVARVRDAVAAANVAAAGGTNPAEAPNKLLDAALKAAARLPGAPDAAGALSGVAYRTAQVLFPSLVR